MNFCLKRPVGPVVCAGLVRQTAIQMIGMTLVGASLVCAPTVALAAGTLAYSHGQAGAGPAAQAGAQSQGQYVAVRDGRFDHNVTVSANSAGYGYGQASSTPGDGYLGLPKMRAVAVGGPDSFNYGYLQSYQAYTWNGATSIDLNVGAFIGRLDYTAEGPGSTYVLASLAIIDGSLRGSQVIQDAWARGTLFGGFTATCDTAGAIGLGSTGPLISSGSISAVVTPTCGAATFHLDPGEEFIVQSRLWVSHAGNGYTNALNTFSIELSPDTPVDVQAALAQNLRLSSTSLAPVPEPATWAMMIVGFGAVGSVLRRRRSWAA